MYSPNGRPCEPWIGNCPYARARPRHKAAGMTRVSDKFYTNPKTYYIAIIVASLPLV